MEWQWSPLEWILGCFSIATVALYLLDRAHRAAIAQLKNSCDVAHSDQQQMIDVLRELLRVRETE